MSSLALHLFPQVAMWNLRWNTLPYEKLLPKNKRTFVTIDEEAEFDWYKFVFIPLIFYYAWVVCYYLINFKFATKRIKERNYENMYVYYSKKSWFNDFMSKYTYPGVVFLSLHFFFWTLCHAWALLCYRYYAVNTFAVGLWLTCSIWNSAGYYFQYFSKKYELSLQRLDQVEKQLQEGEGPKDKKKQ